MFIWNGYLVIERKDMYVGMVVRRLFPRDIGPRNRTTIKKIFDDWVYLEDVPGRSRFKKDMYKSTTPNKYEVTLVADIKHTKIRTGFLFKKYIPISDLTNKGRKICWKCSCKTEIRRDFNSFKLREFCPRCKI